MPYIYVFVAITSFVDKSIKKELYGLGYGHRKPVKIYVAKLTNFFVLKEHKVHKNHYFLLIS